MLIGTETTTLNIEDTEYRAETEIWGTIDDADGSMKLSGRLRAATDLPSGLMWCNGEHDLNLYKDGEYEGHYILRGTIAALCEQSGAVEYTDQ